MSQLLLRFYAIGSYLISAGFFWSEQSELSIVTNATAHFRPRYIKFLILADEIKAEQIKFFDTARFPKVVDCTHVKIQSFGK